MSINWENLYAQGRAKAIGVPWSEEELKALKNGMNVEDVRNGILSEDMREVKEAKMDDLEKKLKVELVELAKEKGISFEENKVTKGDLILLIKQKDE